MVCLAYQKFVSFHLKPFEIGNFVETGFSEISLTIILFWLKMLFDLMSYSRPAGFQRLVECNSVRVLSEKLVGNSAIA